MNLLLSATNPSLNIPIIITFRTTKESSNGVCLELLTAPVTQLLSATEVQGRYKWPHFDAFLSLFWLANSLLFAHRSCQKLKMAKNGLLNNLKDLLNLDYVLLLVLLCKTQRIALFDRWRFLYRSILGTSYFYLYFSYLRKRKTLPHEFFTN